MTEAEKYSLLINIIVPIASAAGAAWVSFRVVKSQIESDHLLFQEQIRIENATKLEIENLDNINKLTNFSWLLDNIIKFATKQNEDYLTVANNIQKDKLGQHPLISRASTDLARILAIKQDDIFLALIAKAKDTQENRTRIGKIYSKLDYVNGIINDIKFKFEGYHITIHSIISDYREHLERVREAVSDTMYDIRMAMPQSFPNDPLFVYLNTTLGNYSQNMPHDAGVEWHHLNFLRPIQEHLAQNFLYDKRAQSTLREGRRASILANRITFESQSNIDMLRNYNKALKKVLDDLKVEWQFVEAVLATT